jgi:hypothetical protein
MLVKKLSLFALLGMMLISADCANDIIGDINFQVPLTRDYSVHSETATYSHLDTVSLPESNADFNKYQDHIKNVTVDSVILVISNNTGVATVLNSAVLSASSVGGSMNLITTLSNLDLTSSAPVKLNLSEAAKSELANYFKTSPYAAVFSFSGTANGAPATFNAQFKFYLSASAEAI